MTQGSESSLFLGKNLYQVPAVLSLMDHFTGQQMMESSIFNQQCQ